MLGHASRPAPRRLPVRDPVVPELRHRPDGGPRKDIRVTPNAFAGLEPAHIAGHGSIAFFAGRSDAHGVELWKSDGTPAGTALVADIWPGAEVLGKETTGSSNPADIQSVGGLVYFMADDGNSGLEVWRSDGTAAGTFLLKDIAPGRAGSVMTTADGFRVHPVGGFVLFPADDIDHGREWWRTDGTPAGTAMVVDLCPGPCSGLDFGPGAVFDGLLYFSGEGASFDRELWRTDGTAAGTMLVANIDPVGEGTPYFLTAAQSMLFFTAFDQAHGGELWATDGTAAGTRLVKDISPGPASSVPALMTAVGDRVFFRGSDPASGYEPWTSDGTAAGTRLVADIAPGPTHSYPWSFVTLGVKACFTAEYVLNQREVFCTDGGAPTLLVDSQGAAQDLLVHQGQIVFTATLANTRRLWWSDGTAAGTRPVGSVNPTYPPYEPASVGNRVFLAGYASSFFSYEIELWASDGTDGGTAQVLDVASVSSNPHSLTSTGDRVVFAADGPNGIEPWGSDGNAAGTDELGDFCGGTCGSLPADDGFLRSPFARAGGYVVFQGGSNGTGREPWRTDGTPAGTQPLADAVPGPIGSEPEMFVTAASKAFFFARSPVGTDIWTTDGTPAGTSPAPPLPGETFFYPWRAAAVQDTLYISGGQGEYGSELFKSDGTVAGTGLVEDLTPGPMGTTIVEMTASGTNLYFRPNHTQQLYRSDGTASGTYAIPSAAWDVAQVTDVHGTVFFRARSSNSGAELWKTDGTEAGTVLVSDIVPGLVGSTPSQLVDVDGTLYFTANDAAHGVELWRSDGTAAGTQMVRDIVPGPAGSVPSSLTEVNGRLYFAAYEPGTGVELWTSDGTPAGTQLVQDFAPGGASSSPSKLTVSGSTLFFVANDGASGREPWALPNLPPSVIVGDVFQPEGDAGTQPATFAIRVVGSHAAPVTLSYMTADGSAVAGSDYQPASGTLSFAPGPSTSQPVAVAVIGDTTEEPDEDFTLVLGGVAGAVPVGAPPRGVVVNDDSPVTVSVADLETIEGDAGTHSAGLTVRLSAPRGVPVTVDYTSEDQTAVAPGDYFSSAGTVTFAPGATAAPVSVAIRGERDLEFDETFRVRIANPVNASLADDTGVTTIRNDDAFQASGRELVHGISIVRDLRTPGMFRLAQQPRSSYEVVVDELTPDVGYVNLWRHDQTLGNILQAGQQVGTGSALSLRWMNTSSTEVVNEHVQVWPSDCGPCAATDRYRLRFYETTLASPRFSNVGSLRTVLTLQNRGAATVNGQVQFWDESGYALNLHPFSLAPLAVLKLETVDLLLLAGASGSVTVAHDGRYDDLAGKTTTLDMANGFGFDHAFASRPR
jgi:ELWxxDGT repeat protein